jgi:hypothetical protein
MTLTDVCLGDFSNTGHRFIIGAVLPLSRPVTNQKWIRLGECVPPSMSALSRQCGIFSTSQPYRPPHGGKKTPWPESANELYRPSDRRLSAKLVPTFAVIRCHVVSVTDPCGRILGFVDPNCYLLFKVASQVYSRGRVDPVPDPLLLRKSGSAGNRTRTSESAARNSDH